MVQRSVRRAAVVLLVGVIQILGPAAPEAGSAAVNLPGFGTVRGTSFIDKQATRCSIQLNFRGTIPAGARTVVAVSGHAHHSGDCVDPHRLAMHVETADRGFDYVCYGSLNNDGIFTCRTVGRPGSFRLTFRVTSVGDATPCCHYKHEGTYSTKVLTG
jgi:hypothetical protein